MQTTAEVLRILSSRQEGIDPPAFLAVGYHKPRAHDAVAHRTPRRCSCRCCTEERSFSDVRMQFVPRRSLTAARQTAADGH
jgi:hypothetical protein